MSLPASTAHARFPVPELMCSQISAASHTGLQITDAQGAPARLAVVNAEGEVIESGDQIAAACWAIAISSYRNLLIGQGHMRVLSAPEKEAAR